VSVNAGGGQAIGSEDHVFYSLAGGFKFPVLPAQQSPQRPELLMVDHVGLVALLQLL
jgi:hypothetical protein